MGFSIYLSGELGLGGGDGAKTWCFDNHRVDQCFDHPMVFHCLRLIILDVQSTECLGFDLLEV